MNLLDISPEVRDALASGMPVVALETTIVSHGMPYPHNIETALQVEQIVHAAARCLSFPRRRMCRFREKNSSR